MSFMDALIPGDRDAEMDGGAMPAGLRLRIKIHKRQQWMDRLNLPWGALRIWMMMTKARMSRQRIGYRVPEGPLELSVSLIEKGGP